MGISFTPAPSKVSPSTTPFFPPNPLRRISQALAGQDVTQAKIMGIGSSTMEGHGVSTNERRSMREFEKSIRKTKSGGGILLPGRVSTFPGYYAALSNGASISASTGESIGWAGRTAVLRDADDTITFTPPPESTGFRIWYGAYSGAPTIRYAIDGAAGVDISTAQGTTDRFKPSNIVALTPGSQHSVVITRSAGTAFAYIRAIEWFVNDTATGVRVLEGGKAGSSTSDFAASTAIAQWQPAVTAVQPDLMIFMLGANDFTSGVPLATTAANIDTIVAAVNAVMTLPTSWMFILPSAAGSANPDQTAYAAWADMYTAAATRAGAYLLDVRPMLPSPGQPGSRYGADNTHLDDIGHATLGQLMATPLKVTS